jgi:uncharacterized protein YbgA (DUF1722 family)/uncharacterized protein YbbK (DUF523 family)
MREIRVASSACLLGHKVRFDGQSKLSKFLFSELSEFVQLIPFCPEVEIGLGTPRATLRLVESESGTRLIQTKTERDFTRELQRYAQRKIHEMNSWNLSGLVVKRSSPSCGMERVKIYNKNAVPARTGRGLFTELFMKDNPLLPVEEEGRLNDIPLRENFLQRVFAYHRLKILFQPGWKIGQLVRFHSREKFLLLAHSPNHYRLLGRLVANPRQRDMKKLSEKYQSLFMAALKVKASPGRHVNVLQHMAGFFKKELSSEQKIELNSLFDDLANKLVPLSVPLTLVRHYIRQFSIKYLAVQSYIEPCPKGLKIRVNV